MSDWHRRFPALNHDIRATSPMVDQIEAAQKPANVIMKPNGRERPRAVRRRDFSPGAQWHPRISAALDDAKLVKTTVADVRWYEDHGLTYLNSNLPDRLPREAIYGPGDVSPGEEPDYYHPDDGHALDDVVPLNYREHVAQYRSSLAVSSAGPFAHCVVLIDPNAPTFTPPLPWKWTDEGHVEPSVVAWPVPEGFSVGRVARFALERKSRCRWCSATRPERGLLVQAGATVYVFPTCLPCGSRLEEDFGQAPDCLDFETCDGWDRASGYPADDWR